MEITGADIVKRIDQVLAEERISYIEACRGAGITDHSITDWKGTKNKKGSMPSADKLFKVASYLKISLYWLLTGKDEEGLTPEQRKLLRNYGRLDNRDKETVLGLIETMLKKQEKEEKPVYSDIQAVALETKEAEPAYRPAIDRVIFNDWGVVMIPYYGKTAAGRPINISIEPEYGYPFPEIAIHGDIKDYYCLTVCGTSMTEANIHDGDIALIRHAEEPENGEIMLVRYADESTLKRIRIRRETVYLCWEDGSGQEIKADSDEYEIQGRLVNMWRKPKSR